MHAACDNPLRYRVESYKYNSCWRHAPACISIHYAFHQMLRQLHPEHVTLGLIGLNFPRGRPLIEAAIWFNTPRPLLIGKGNLVDRQQRSGLGPAEFELGRGIWSGWTACNPPHWLSGRQTTPHGGESSHGAHYMHRPIAQSPIYQKRF